MIGLGARLRDLRKGLKLSQAEVARQLQLSKSTVAGYESNSTSPSLESLSMLANFYGVSTDYILGREKSKKITADLSSLDDEQLQIVHLLLEKFKQGN